MRIWSNFGHGYCLTSYSSQSKSVDCVFVAENSESFRATDREQFYVSASRFREALTIYTDDKRQLLAAVSKSSERPSATDLVAKQLSETSGRPGTDKSGGPPIPEEGIEGVPKQTPVQRPKTIPVHRRHLIHKRIT